ncbi:hypothetical protein TSUD_387850 [Trifolium subterraneum]|uniref:Uncharacterized protein n=1 Tax=Trifolium subterraneum TaxID=3900 RepID=A0A2Z6MXA6_TRISU|nr:hypothetical protein TSUD_387850 [Trifolium subterraneum]
MHQLLGQPCSSIVAAVKAENFEFYLPELNGLEGKIFLFKVEKIPLPNLLSEDSVRVKRVFHVECIPATQLDKFVSDMIVSPFDLADSKGDDRPGSYVKRSLSHVFDEVATFEACKPLKTIKIEKE